MKISGKDIRKEQYLEYRRRLDDLTIAEAQSLFDDCVQRSNQFQIVLSADCSNEPLRLPNSVVQLFKAYESVQYKEVLISRQQLSASRLDNSVLIGTDSELLIVVRGN